MAKSKLVQMNKKIEKGVVDGFVKIRDNVTGSYEKIENKFVDNYLTREGETIEDAKKRLKEDQRSHQYGGSK